MSSPGIGRLFDLVAPAYDQSGVAFFGPIADLLVDLLDPQPGERCLDVGCGRGAVTARLVDRVGPSGEVHALDLSPQMVRLTAAEVPGARVEVGDAMAPGPADAGWDVIASGLVLFFLPDPVAGLDAWRERLRPGGRVGVSTFGAQDEIWTGVDEVLRPYLPAQDPRSVEAMARFRTDEGVEAMLTAAGLDEVRSERTSLPVVFADTDQWFAFSMSTGQRRAWETVPEAERAAVRARCEEALEGGRRSDGAFEVAQDVRVTTGLRPL